ncbi:hypothetical protein [Actinacidiphila sp. ITFR-21]|uniref:hypothetical protein n=1 Tax=Actinacidiphila sp. ITFR-21 TaxID=3075199 RepID=UPI00288BC59E|nr:hypothetical protein [Streptomyces sp. ITFR-21]WNI19139.1 hypothetical protein RLT57_28785 [Streptomyces sp. ITFR-21]
MTAVFDHIHRTPRIAGTPTKALTIRQPYADAIVQPSDCPKRIENRSWPLPARYVGVPVLLHSAAAPERKPVLPDAWDIGRPFGHLYGVRPLGQLGVILAQATFASYHFPGDGCDEQCVAWGMRQVFHWRISNLVPLAEPIPAKGQQQFWTPPDDVLAAVQAQLPQHATT